MCKEKNVLVIEVNVEEALGAFQGKDVVVDIIGSISTLKFFSDFSFWTDGTDDQVLVLSSSQAEDYFYIDLNNVESIEVDPITEQIDIEMTNGMTVSLCEQ